MALLREIQKNPKLPYRVRGFLDDRPENKGVRILGMAVLGRLLVALKEIVFDYSPSAELLKRVVEARDSRTVMAVE